MARGIDGGGSDVSNTAAHPLPGVAQHDVLGRRVICKFPFNHNPKSPHLEENIRAMLTMKKNGLCVSGDAKL